MEEVVRKSNRLRKLLKNADALEISTDELREENE